MSARQRVSMGVLAVMLSAATAATASASVILTYVGNPYGSNTFVPTSGAVPADGYQSTDHVTVTLTLAAELDASLVNASVTPLAFSIADGVNAITQAGATSTRFKFTTDAGKNIVGWSIDVQEQTSTYFHWILTGTGLDQGYDATCGPGSNATSCVLGPNNYNQTGMSQDRPGTWAYERPTTVPEPMTAALVGLGVLVAGVRRTRHQ